MQLSTGFIIVGAYADKIRKTLFAQLRDAVKRGEVDSREVARASAELNRLLYRIVVDELKSDKGDVIRARIDYDVSGGKISWKYDTLKVEYFKRVPDDEVAKHVEKVVAVAEEVVAERIAYEVKEVVTTAMGDCVLEVMLGERKVGMLAATPLGDLIAVRGAVLEPNPVLVRGKLPAQGSMAETVRRGLQSLIEASEAVDVEEAEKAIKELEAVVERERGGSS